MKIIIDEAAYDFLKDDMELSEGDSVRFFVKYGGESSIQKGYSLGITKDIPRNLAVNESFNGVDFYVEDGDQWYFDQHNLHVTYQAAIDEIGYQYE